MFDTVTYFIDTPTERYPIVGWTHALEAAEAEAFGAHGGPNYRGYAEIKVQDEEGVTLTRFIRDGFHITRE